MKTLSIDELWNVVKPKETTWWFWCQRIIVKAIAWFTRTEDETKSKQSRLQKMERKKRLRKYEQIRQDWSNVSVMEIGKRKDRREERKCHYCIRTVECRKNNAVLRREKKIKLTWYYQGKRGIEKAWESWKIQIDLQRMDQLETNIDEIIEKRQWTF